jgi:ElaB/YqjD/DUF883 family membrane-anchored ribosome-binding protein
MADVHDFGSSSGDKMQKGVDDLAGRAKGAIDSAAAAASDTLAKVEDAGKQAWDMGVKVSAQAKDQAQDVAGKVSDQATRGLQGLTRQIQAEPILSICIAGAVGYFLGMLGPRR